MGGVCGTGWETVSCSCEPGVYAVAGDSMVLETLGRYGTMTDAISEELAVCGA